MEIREVTQYTKYTWVQSGNEWINCLGMHSFNKLFIVCQLIRQIRLMLSENHDVTSARKEECILAWPWTTPILGHKVIWWCGEHLSYKFNSEQKNEKCWNTKTQISTWEKLLSKNHYQSIQVKSILCPKRPGENVLTIKAVVLWTTGEFSPHGTFGIVCKHFLVITLEELLLAFSGHKKGYCLQAQ